MSDKTEPSKNYFPKITQLVSNEIVIQPIEAGFLNCLGY